MVYAIEIIIIQKGGLIGLKMTPLTFDHYVVAGLIGVGILLWDVLTRSVKQAYIKRQERKASLQ